MKNFRLVILVLVAALSSAPGHGQVILIANPAVKWSEVSKSDLRDVFLGSASSFKDGAHVVPVLLKACGVSDDFLSAYVGKTDTAFRASWRSLLFSGQATMPRTLETEAAVVDYVAHTPGAVGYIGKSTPHEGVKVLAIH